MKKAPTAQQMTIKMDIIIIMVFFTPETETRTKREIRFTNKKFPTWRPALRIFP